MISKTLVNSSCYAVVCIIRQQYVSGNLYEHMFTVDFNIESLH